MASSTLLSMISWARWVGRLVSVYIPGRRLTGSSPLAKLVPPPAANADAAALARYFRKGYFQSFRRLASGRYMGPIARQLNGRIGLFRALGRHATWYVPAVIGLYNVFDAAPEVRMHALFEEGFGVVGGGFGN
jgi:hypothetical protein